MRRKGGGKEFIDNKGCRVSPRYLTIAKTEGEKKGGHRPKGEKKTVLRDPECQRHGGLARSKKDIDQEINRKHKQRLRGELRREVGRGG